LDEFNYGEDANQPEAEQVVDQSAAQLQAMQAELAETRRAMQRLSEDNSRLNASTVEMAMAVQRQQQQQTAPQPVAAGNDWSSYFGVQDQTQQQAVQAGPSARDLDRMVEDKFDKKMTELARQSADFEARKQRLVSDFWANQKDLHQASKTVENIAGEFLRIPGTSLEDAYAKAITHVRESKGVFKPSGGRAPNIPGGSGGGNPNAPRPKGDTPYPLLGYMDGLPIVKYSREDEQKASEDYVALRNKQRAYRTFNEEIK